MGLFDIFSNDKAEEAAAQRNAGLQQGYEALSSAYGKGRDALTTGANTASGIYGGLGEYFKTTYAPGAQAYGDAVGANGADGYARARTNFQVDPGYNFARDQGLQALQRTHAAAGNLSSGNADIDTLKFSQGLADQSYGNYVTRLAPYLSLAGSGATTAATGQANAATGLASGLANLFQNEGNAANANYTGQGASNAAATMNEYNISKNMWDGIGKVASTAGNLFGVFA